MLVCQLQGWDAVLIIEWHGCAVDNRLVEVVDTDIVPEHGFCLFFASHEGCTGKCDECCVGERGAHVQRQGMVLAAVCFIGDDDDVEPL